MSKEGKSVEELIESAKSKGLGRAEILLSTMKGLVEIIVPNGKITLDSELKMKIHVSELGEEELIGIGELANQCKAGGEFTVYAKRSGTGITILFERSAK